MDRTFLISIAIAFASWNPCAGNDVAFKKTALFAEDSVFARRSATEDAADAYNVETCGFDCDDDECGDCDQYSTKCRHGRCRASGDPASDSWVDRYLPRLNLPLPLLQGLVEGRDVPPLPPPLGMSFVWTNLNRHLVIDDVRLGLGANVPVSVERVSVPETTFHASSQIGRVDLWVLPFLNIYGIVGHTRTTGDVAVTINQFPSPFSPPVTIDIPVVLEGPTAGFGGTTGIGTKNWFGMLDINHTWTNFSNLDSSLTALVVTPRVGRVMDLPWWKGEVHVGAMWQLADQTVELTLDHPALGNDLHVEVDQTEPRKWNFLVGGLYALNERLQLFVEGGMGGRSYVISGVSLRF